MAEIFTSPYRHGNYDVIRFWKDGSLLLGASDLTGRLWSGVLRRFDDAAEAVRTADNISLIRTSNVNTTISVDSISTHCAQGGDVEVMSNGFDSTLPLPQPPPVPPITSTLLESTVADAIAFPLNDVSDAYSPLGGEVENGDSSDGVATLSQHKAVMAYDSGSIEVLELTFDETGQSQPIFVTAAHMCEHDDMVSSIVLNCNHQKLISGSYDKSIKIWSTETWTTVATYLFAHGDHVLMVASHLEEPDIFASCSKDGRALLWDTRQQRPASILQKSTGVVPSALAWQPSSQGTKLVMGNERGEIMLKDVRKEKENLNQVKKHDREITRLEFDLWSANKIAVCANETKFLVLHLGEDIFSVMYEDDTHNDFVRCAAWHPKTRDIYTCSWDSRIIQHDAHPIMNIQ